MKKLKMSVPVIFTVSLILSGCGKEKEANKGPQSPETNIQAARIIKQQIDGKNALRFETFGNESFWSDVVKLPRGIEESKITPAQLLALGISINSQNLKAETLTALNDEIKLHGLKGPMLNDPSTTQTLLNSNAFIGLVTKDTNQDRVLDVTSGDKVGVSCVLCHAVTDKTVFEVPTGGSIGVQIDGPAVPNLQLGKLFAIAANTKGFYPMAQLRTAGGRSIGRAPAYVGLFNYYSEADFDAYFSNPKYYPAGAFDDTPDGHGNPVVNAPLFRQDLAAPFGSAGEKATFVDYANTVFTLLMDPTILVTDEGRLYLNRLAGTSGDRIAKEYLEVLEEIGVRKYGLIRTNRKGTPGSPETMVGVGVDLPTLKAMEAYVNSLRSPAGVIKDLAAVERGKNVYSDPANKCLNCHNSSQANPVKNEIVDMKVIFPGDTASVIGKRSLPFNPMMNTSSRTYDDKMITVNASIRGLVRGSAMPLLMDLARKNRFLHDGSVETLEKLFDSSRGSMAPHPFYIKAEARQDLVQFLQSLDDKQ